MHSVDNGKKVGSTLHGHYQFYCSIAQLAVRLTLNQEVTSSNLVGAANFMPDWLSGDSTDFVSPQSKGSRGFESHIRLLF
jgi:hypothetical protein